MHDTVTTVVLVGWAVFWVGWIASSVGNKPGQTRFGRYAGFRLVVIVLVAVAFRIGAVPRHAAIGGPWAKGVGLCLYALGLALAIWARVHIGRNWGMPMSQKSEPELITTGPYRTIRHPIYSGLILALVGSAVATSLLWLAVAVPLAGYFVYSARAEERYMTERFPDAYPAYQQSSKMLIPFIL